MIFRRSQPAQINGTHAGLRPPAVRIARYLLIVLAIPTFSYCVSLQVEPLTEQRFPPREHFTQVEVLTAEPARPYVKLARITATSENASEETLRNRILARARQLGADAVVLGKTDVLESMGPSPAYQSTVNSAVVNTNGFTWGPWGWWTPFYLDSWSFMQGGADQTQFTVYLSGVAIRYDDAAAGERMP